MSQKRRNTGDMLRFGTAALGLANQALKRRRGYGSVTETVPDNSAGFSSTRNNSGQARKTVVKGKKKSVIQKLAMIHKMSETSIIFRFQGINPANPFTQMPCMTTSGYNPGFAQLNKVWTDATLTAMKLPIYVIALSGACRTLSTIGLKRYTYPMWRLHKVVTASSATDQSTANYSWEPIQGQQADGTTLSYEWQPEKDNTITDNSRDKYFYENNWTNVELAFYLGQLGTQAKIHTSLIKFKKGQGPRRSTGIEAIDPGASTAEQHNMDIWWTHHLDRHIVGPISSTPSFESKKPYIETSKDCTCLATNAQTYGSDFTKTNFVKRIFFKDESLYKYDKTRIAESYIKPNILTSLDGTGYPISNYSEQKAYDVGQVSCLSYETADTYLLIQGDHFGKIDAFNATTIPLTFDFKIRCKQTYNSTN